MPRASTTRITGRSNRLARSAVEPWLSAAPSNSPITPSPRTRSASRTIASPSPASVSSRIAQLSKLKQGREVARAWNIGSR